MIDRVLVELLVTSLRHNVLITSITVGVRRAVRMPLRVRPRLAYAPTNWSRSMAADVPRAWDAAPIDNPRAMGL